ncbi:MAG: hypothetical protein H7A25_18105 [Leptospiraceae bacterium]|nr:hypothetical protein [Leptospiraceae bacterium]MCP5501821.1 hypothetical protein [Leptospiraceae bacterium]
MSIPPKLSISYVVMRIKGYVSYKMKSVYWQGGYYVRCVPHTRFGKGVGCKKLDRF